MATIVVKSHITEVKSKMAENQQKFAEIVGSMCEDYTRDKIMRGYAESHGADEHTAIYDTGALHDSITSSSETKPSRTIVRVGVPSKTKPAAYAIFVHDGTYKLHGRPFIRDAIMGNLDELKETVKGVVKEGF